MIIKIASVLILTISLIGCGGVRTEQINENGKIEFPEITQETKPWTRWWWHGNAVSEKDITAALEAYQKAGLGGVEITPIYGVRGEEKRFIELLSPEWMEKIVYTLNEAERLGLGVDLANASGWPFGGPWVDEETACKNMVSKTFELQGGQKLLKPIKYVQQPILRTASGKKISINDIKRPVTANKNMQEYAFDQVRYERKLPLIVVTANKKENNNFVEVINLTDKVVNGKLDWTAPEGDWIVCALFQGDHGKMVERAGPGGEGNVIDHFSSEALKKYLDKYDEAFQGYDLGYLRYFFNDSYEVDDAIGESNWTTDFFSDFKKTHGYDLKEYLPALLGFDTEEMNNRVLYDYRIAIGDLLLEKYTENWQKWATAKGKGIRSQSHGSPANILDLYAASTVPEIEGQDIVNLKSAPSAAHVTGKRLTSSESCTWLNDHFQSTLGDVKTAVDKMLLAGVNHIFYHGTAYSPQDAPWPGWVFYAAVHFEPNNSFWDDFSVFNQYVARVQSFLQAGKPSNDILLYFAIADLWSEPINSGLLRHFNSDAFNEISLKACGDFLTEQGYSWDAVSDKQLMNISCEKSYLYTGGNVYKTIMIPETHYMPVETFEKLIELVENGATVIFLKELPADVPGLAGLEASRNKMNSLKEKLSFTEKDNIRIAKHGKGKIVVAGDIEDIAVNSGIEPESMYSSGLQCIRRLKDDGNFYYFIKNTSGEPFEGWVTLNAKLNSAALYNPMTNISGYAITRKSNGNSEIYVQMKPEESLVVVTFSKKYTGDLYPFYKISGEPVALSGNINIEFVKGGPTLPPKILTDKLSSWTLYGPEYAAFSGTAEYTTQIPALLRNYDAVLLDLGTVNESASIYVNGKYLGTLINSPYTIEIPGDLLKGNDELKIAVSNLSANRIADLDKKGVEWRIFYNTNVNARLRQNTGADGKFSAANWEPRDSGLSGQITVTPIVKIK